MSNYLRYRNFRHNPLVTLDDFQQHYAGRKPLYHYRVTLLSMEDWSRLDTLGAIERPCLQVFVWDAYDDELAILDVRFEEIA